MLNQHAVDIPTLPVNLCFSHLIHFLVECSAVLLECRAAKMGRQAFGTHKVYRETFFANPAASSSAPYPQELNPWSSKKSENISNAGKSENQTPVQDQRRQSRPPARNSVIPREGDLKRIMGQTNNDCRSQIFISKNSPHQQHSLVGRQDSRLRYVLVHNFTRKLCCGSNKWSWLIQWMI